MGFRNPVTSVSSLDTGQGFARGSVESFTDNPTGPLGTPLHTAAGFYFRDGITGDAPAALVNEAYYAAQGDNSLTGQGGLFAVVAGSYNNVQGPELDLGVESAGAGGYAAVARLQRAGLQIDSPGTRIQGLVPLLGAAGGTVASTDANGQVTVTHGLGVNPATVIVSPAASGVIPNLVDFVVVSWTASQFTVRAIRRDNNTVFSGNPVGFQWLAVLPAP